MQASDGNVTSRLLAVGCAGTREGRLRFTATWERCLNCHSEYLECPIAAPSLISVSQLPADIPRNREGSGQHVVRNAETIQGPSRDDRVRSLVTSAASEGGPRWRRAADSGEVYDGIGTARGRTDGLAPVPTAKPPDRRRHRLKTVI